MKKVIFICLLSLSMCLCRPDNQPAPPAQTPPANTQTLAPKPDTPPAHVDPAPGDAKATTTPQISTAVTNGTPAAVTTTVNGTAAQTTQNDTKSTSPPGANENKTNDTKTDTNENKTNPEKKADTGKNENKVEPSKDDKNATAADGKGTADNSTVINNGTKPENKDDKVSTTQKPEVTTKAPSGEKTVQARGFDGPSFIGGIILTLGLLAIGFMGFKYYKNQTERNYHTL